jgi:hypothetical protein
MLAAAAIVALAAGAMLATPTASQAAGRPVGPLSPDSGVLFGAMTNENRATPDGTVAEVSALESQIGRKLAIDHRFYTYKEAFFPKDPAVGMSDEAWDWANGRYSMITWGATDTYSYENGSQDAWVTAQAQRMAAFGHPIFLRFYHEPDGDYRKNQVHSAADYIAAWRHVHDLFLAAGATNVVWVWCPTAWKFNVKNPTPPSYYPGGDVVDWIAADGYNWNPAKPNTKWRSFAQVFQKFYNWAITMNKPIMAAEYGVMEDPTYTAGNRKAQWFNDMVTTLQTTMTQFQAVLYFDTTMVKGGITYQWDLDSSTQALNAWAAAGATGYLGAAPAIP